MAHWIKALGARPAQLSSIPRAHAGDIYIHTQLTPLARTAFECIVRLNYNP